MSTVRIDIHVRIDVHADQFSTRCSSWAALRCFRQPSVLTTTSQRDDQQHADQLCER